MQPSLSYAEPPLLFRNLGHGKFEDVNSGAFGKKYLPETMGSGVCFIDYDNDGWQDILFVNSMDWPGHKTHKSYPALYHNNHDGTFTDVTARAGLDVEMYGMGCVVGDFDNDGNDDIYITALDHNRLFRNLGNGRFTDVTAQAGVGSSGFSTGAAWFDYDNDGKLDLVVDHYVDWSIATDKFCSLDESHKSYCTPELYKGESVTLYHNLGHGRFKDVTSAAGLHDPTDKALGIALIDYDNDGWLDLLITNDTQPKYVISFLVLAVIRSWIIHEPWLSEVSPITGPEYQLFIFFMITDPKTTVRSKRGQCVVAFLVALVEMFFRLDQSIYAELYALFWVGPIALLVEMWLNSRRAKVAPAVVPALTTASGTSQQSTI